MSAVEVMSKAAELGATPFDVAGCELGHHGEDVSFNSILKKYKLTEPALALLGEIVRAADSHPGSPHPAGEGLRWVTRIALLKSHGKEWFEGKFLPEFHPVMIGALLVTLVLRGKRRQTGAVGRADFHSKGDWLL